MRVLLISRVSPRPRTILSAEFAHSGFFRSDCVPEIPSSAAFTRRDINTITKQSVKRRKMLGYELCPSYGKPLPNAYNVVILRTRAAIYMVIGTLTGGLIGVALLPILGFGLAGVASGSIAAAWQSSLGLVSAGSTFALLQSLGATGLGSLMFGAIGSAAGAGTGALGIIMRNPKSFGWCTCGCGTKRCSADWSN